ncbi:3'(2'),5'-bisphosphate nucleotidase CysQ [Candidatus Neomarinimicrobiota bacterium]
MQDVLEVAIAGARAAGEILLSYYQEDYQVRDKGYHNPVTTADYASDKYLQDYLLGHYPNYGWLSEETIDSRERLTKERVWVVDPLDGTKEFIEGVPQFVVSVALVEHGESIVGVLHNPVSGEIFSAARDEGAHLGGVSIRTSSLTDLGQAEILNSRSETRRGLWKPYTDRIHSLRAVGSVAYKLGLVAAGQADVFASLRPKNEWDICAGNCILDEAGAQLKTLKGETIRYNQRHVLITPGLVAGNPDIVQAFLQLYGSA